MRRIPEVRPPTVVRLTPSPSRVRLTPAHKDEGPEHAQEQGHLQQHQEQAVDGAERNPVGDMVTGN